MEANELEVLNSIDMENLSLTYVEEMLERKWNEKDIEKCNLSRYSNKNFLEKTVATYGTNYFVSQHFRISGNSVVTLF